MAAFLPFSFFLAYAFMSIPSGMIIERWGERLVLVIAFLMTLLGSLFFCLKPVYSTALASLFLIGVGMAALQVAINPLLRVSGGEEHYAFNAVLAQLIFGIASFASPLLYSYFATGVPHFYGLIPTELPWLALYWIFVLISLGMVLLITVVRFPKVERNEDERTGALHTHLELLKQPVVWLYFVGIFSYVGLEQGLSNWMSQFLASQHGFNPQIEGALAVSRFWGLMTLGCALGLVLLKFMDSKPVLFVFSLATVATISAAIFGSPAISIFAFPAAGFTISVMWSIIFSLALNSLPKNHGTFSGILCTGIVGGALIPFLIGSAGDAIGLRAGLSLLYIPLFYILSMAFWAKPLIRNQTLKSS